MSNHFLDGFGIWLVLTGSIIRCFRCINKIFFIRRTLWLLFVTNTHSDIPVIIRIKDRDVNETRLARDSKKIWELENYISRRREYQESEWSAIESLLSSSDSPSAVYDGLQSIDTNWAGREKEGCNHRQSPQAQPVHTVSVILSTYRFSKPQTFLIDLI